MNEVDKAGTLVYPARLHFAQAETCKQSDERERRVVDAIASLETLCREEGMPFAAAVQVCDGTAYVVNPDGTETRTGSCWSRWQLKTNMDADELEYLSGMWRVRPEHEQK